MSEFTLAKDISITSGFAFSSALFDPEHGEPLIRIRDIQGQKTAVKYTGTYSKEYVVETGDLLVGMDGDFNVVRWLGAKALLNQRVCKIESVSDEVHQGFLFWYLQPKLKEIHAVTPQTTVKHLSVKDIYAIEKPCFNYLEQEMIANILDTLDTQLRETEAIIAKLQQVKQGLLHDLLTRGVDKNGELRPSYEDAPELYQSSELGWIPKDWNEVSLADISIIKSGSTPSRTKAEVYFCSEGGFPWVKTMDLNEDVIVQTDEQITQKALEKTSCILYPQESVLVAMYGGWEQIGRVAILADEAATNQAISALIFNKDGIVPEFVLRSLQFHRPGWKKVAASTRKDPNITKSDVEKFKIAVPENTDEQKYIVEIYREMINKTNAEKLSLDKLISKKSGLMDDLLTGKVRVTELLKSK
ncbi:restriction endonuclease subunit S [Vibrio parahaemolyticus]